MFIERRGKMSQEFFIAADLILLFVFYSLALKINYGRPTFYLIAESGITTVLIIILLYAFACSKYSESLTGQYLANAGITIDVVGITSTFCFLLSFIVVFTVWLSILFDILQAILDHNHRPSILR